jgi:hypothetical protein
MCFKNERATRSLQDTRLVTRRLQRHVGRPDCFDYPLHCLYNPCSGRLSRIVAGAASLYVEVSGLRQIDIQRLQVLHYLYV